MLSLDIIIPVKDESGSISELVNRIHAACRRGRINYRLIFVDDRSTDGTVERIKHLAGKFPILLHIKTGRPGKAYSILEGVRLARTEYVAMIDGDLQYPPEVIGEMMNQTPKHGVVVANRKSRREPAFRRLLSRINSLLVGRLLLGFDCDIQSGLKLFRRDIISHLPGHNISSWAIDVPILTTARDLGYSIGTVDIEFADRPAGRSKINWLEATRQITLGALKTKLSPSRILHLPPRQPKSMLHAGVVYRRQRFVTHTTLPHHRSALISFSSGQKLVWITLLGSLAVGLILNIHATVLTAIAVLSAIYFLDTVFNLFLVLKSLHFPPEISFTPAEINSLTDSELPVYTILCPLYKEARILPHFVSAIDRLNWPKDKLDVQLLLEEDDSETMEAVKNMSLPSHFRTLVVPHSLPKTKPKACNYGLHHARGEYVVIYDAEDEPDPDQLKKAFVGFSRSPRQVVCLQAKLNYYNPHHNLLTRLFTAEYSLWFDVILTGLQSINTTIPLGGTSNHFRTRDLKQLQGWDPFNVTEDCDLGVRLFKNGYRTAVIDSTTLEEANSHLGNWLRQRSRWIKGYIQTYLVHMRRPWEMIRSHGWHFFLFQLVVGGKIAFMLINPFLWLATISYFVLNAYVGPAIESLYPASVFYMAAFSFVAGNFLFLYYYMIGCAKRGHWSLIKYVYLVPFYWLMVSVAAGKALWQLLVKPHYWEKTLHGLHLPRVSPAAAPVSARPVFRPGFRLSPVFARLSRSTFFSGSILVAATVVSHFFNFLYTAYLGRSHSVSTAEFGVISLVGSLLYIVEIPSLALSKTITFRSAYLLGRHRVTISRYWKFIRGKTLPWAVIATLMWLVSLPLLSRYFQSGSMLPFLLFSPIWLIVALSSVDRGFLSGNHKFGLLAVIAVFEAVLKLILAVVFVQLGWTPWIYLVMPLSMAASFIVGWQAAKRIKDTSSGLDDQTVFHFPKKFYAASLLVRLSSIAFISLDVILAKILLSAEQAGQYALVSTVGKVVYYMGSMFAQFITPVVSRSEGAGTNSRRTFYGLLGITTLVGLSGFLIFGLLAPYTVPFLFGPKTIPVLPLLPLYTLSIVAFSVANNFVSYHQIRRHYSFPMLGFFMAGIQIFSLVLFHDDVSMFVSVMLLLSVIYLGATMAGHIFYSQLVTIFRNILDFLGLFASYNGKSRISRQRILIFNWRDKSHKWAGGAEVYLHELAKRWVKSGHSVTIFCGNDGHSPRNEKIDGIRFIRRGGFFTVYIWAFLYYLLKFRRRFDLVIDSENGIPFFTPLFVRIPVLLLIHHVHQDLFRSKLYFPADQIALFLETKLMPLVYRRTRVITVSESSRRDIISLGFFKPEHIEVIQPGIEPEQFAPVVKTRHPSFVYLGRIRSQKNIDVAIKAFSRVVKQYPRATLSIAGWGDQVEKLKSLAGDLNISGQVKFLGRISEEEKAQLLGKSWAMIQPSSFEGWGITVIEANACGTPVIASDVSGLRDSVVNKVTGMLVPPLSPSALAKAMVFLISHHGYRRKLSSSARHWSSNFDWEYQAGKFLETMKNYLSEQYPRYPVSRQPALAKQWYDS